jgi:hypothetical protein
VIFPAAGLSGRTSTLLTCLCHCPLTPSLGVHIYTCMPRYSINSYLLATPAS